MASRRTIVALPPAVQISPREWGKYSEALAPTRSGLFAGLMAWLSLCSGCALSHERAADASSDGSSARLDTDASGECTIPVLERSSLSPEQRSGLFGRLRHEVSHLARAVEGIAAGTMPPEDDWAFDEDHGSMVVAGDLELRGDEVELVAEISFTHWTGRHGGWGYSALEGMACVTIVAPRVPEPGTSFVTVDAAIHLVDDGPLLGSPHVNVHYTASGTSLEGTVAGEPVGDGR